VKFPVLQGEARNGACDRTCAAHRRLSATCPACRVLIDWKFVFGGVVCVKLTVVLRSPLFGNALVYDFACALTDAGDAELCIKSACDAVPRTSGRGGLLLLALDQPRRTDAGRYPYHSSGKGFLHSLSLRLESWQFPGAKLGFVTSDRSSAAACRKRARPTRRYRLRDTKLVFGDDFCEAALVATLGPALVTT